MVKRVHQDQDQEKIALDNFNGINEFINTLIMKNNIPQNQIKNWTHSIYNRELINAIDLSDEKLVYLLLEAGANPNYNKAIISAANNNNRKIIKLLLDYGADANTTNKSGETYVDILDIIDDAIKFVTSEDMSEMTELMQELGRVGSKRTRRS